MALIDQYEIPEGTYDNGNIKGTKRWHQIKAHIAAMSNDRLEEMFTDYFAPDGRFNYDRPVFRQFASECSDPGVGINLTSLMLSLAEAAYCRDDENGNSILPEDDYLRLQDEA